MEIKAVLAQPELPRKKDFDSALRAAATPKHARL